MYDWPWYLLILFYGACVGSFLNVVIYRLPAGKSIVTPPSACPHCGNTLRMWENIPVFAWFMLGGKCARCKTSISFQYPAIEFLTAMLFVCLPLVYYHTGMQPAFAKAGLMDSWPILIVHLMLLAALVAATMIDLKHYIIPLGIPYVIVILAMVVYPVATYLKPEVVHTAGMVDTGGVRIALGGVIGLILANVLLRVGILPTSFADEEVWFKAAEKQLADEAEQKAKASAEAGGEDQTHVEETQHTTPIDLYLLYPFTRREMGKESLFLMIPLIGMIVGYYFLPIGEAFVGTFWLRVLGNVILGYLVGGAAIWGVRIMGSYAFGKEAMGLGDVHLLAAIGAVLGPMDPLIVFLLAPFFGLISALICFGVSRIYKGQARVIPYGPYLALATLVIMLLRAPIAHLFLASQF